MKSKLTNLKIGKKFFFVFAIILALFIVSSIASIIGLITVGDHTQAFHDEPYAYTQLSADMRVGMQRVIKSTLIAASTEDIATTQSALTEAQERDAIILESLETLQEYNVETERLAKISESIAVVVDIRTRVFDLLTENTAQSNAEALEIIMNEFIPAITPVTVQLTDLQTAIDVIGQNNLNESDEIELFVTILIISLVMLTITLTVYFALTITKLLTKPISELEKAAFDLKNGNLNTTISYRSNDELGSLSSSLSGVVEMFKTIIPDINYCLDTMANGDFTVQTRAQDSYIGDYAPILQAISDLRLKLSDTLRDIQESATQVQSGAQNMSQGAQTLATGATDQASAVEELTATMAELSSQVEADAKKTGVAAVDARKVGEEALGSQQHMQKMIVAMENINRTSSQIQAIINTIEEIASQTNLLSLNAAIEAARAGEAGRGFAVVADEIRQLAAQSAAASTNTRNLIQTAVVEINNGNSIVEETSVSLQSVITNVNRIVGVMEEVKESSSAQASSMNEVNQGIEQISAVIQDTSATAQESSAISEELFAQAETLNGLVRNFKLAQA
ncbi:MAG: methyl-accepting chemotaxis protein [Clostridium sp.]|jgi:methyl-accepting chemotaxis protein|nr:methyl-accepting chemotaxis protein [Clostridium sp.]